MADIGRRAALGLATAAGIARRTRAQAPQEVKIAMLVPLSGQLGRNSRYCRSTRAI